MNFLEEIRVEAQRLAAQVRAKANQVSWQGALFQWLSLINRWDRDRQIRAINRWHRKCYQNVWAIRMAESLGKLKRRSISVMAWWQWVTFVGSMRLYRTFVACGKVSQVITIFLITIFFFQLSCAVSFSKIIDSDVTEMKRVVEHQRQLSSNTAYHGLTLAVNLATESYHRELVSRLFHPFIFARK